MLLKKITLDIIEKFTNEMKESENINKLKDTLLDPIFAYTYEKLSKYIVFISILFIVICLLVILNFIILVRILIKKK